MKRQIPARAALFGLALLPHAGGSAIAAVSIPPTVAGVTNARAARGPEPVQYRPPGGGYGGYAIAPRGYAPRAYAPRAYAPRYVPGRAYYAPRGYYGRPYWFARPWNPRPYYGTILGGVALGALITVAAVGYVPPRPAPNLCWYWADPDGAQGYWDYCN